MAIKNYYPISMNYLQERYQFWLEHFSHSEDKEKLAFEEAKKDVEFRKKQQTRINQEILYKEMNNENYIRKSKKSCTRY